MPNSVLGAGSSTPNKLTRGHQLEGPYRYSSRAGFLNISTVGILGREWFIVVGAALCIGMCVAAFLTPFHKCQQYPTP